MRSVGIVTTALLLALAVSRVPAGAGEQLAQAAPASGSKVGQTTGQAPGQPGAQQTAPQPAPPKPYKAVPVAFPPPLNDPSFEAFRKELTGVAQRKDRAALGRMVVAKGFFWDTEDGKGADAKKSSIENLALAIGLDAKDSGGWDALAAMAAEPTASADPNKKDVVCTPATADIDEKEFENLVKSTQTDPAEWGYPTSAGVEVHASPQAKSATVEKLGMDLVRVLPETAPAAAVAGEDWVRVVAPDGKVGFVLSASLMSLDNDELCFAKESGNWKIAGVVGGSSGDGGQ